MPQEGIPPLSDSAHAGPSGGDDDFDALSAHSDEHDNQSWRMSVLMGITRIVLRFPVATVALAIALSGVCFVYSYTHLGYKSSRLDLLNPKSDHNRLWIEYVNEFGDEDDAVIVVEGPGRDQVVPVLVELSQALGREKRLFHAILHEVDLSAIRAKGLHYLPVGELANDRSLSRLRPLPSQAASGRTCRSESSWPG